MNRIAVCAAALMCAAVSVAGQDRMPPPSAGHALVYHAGLERVVLVNAGAASDPATIDKPTGLWSWDGASWALLDGNGPTPRELAGICYDAARDVIVLYGGTTGRGRTYYDETWEWSRTTGWKRINVAGPGPRHHTRLVYDPIRRVSVLFGGLDAAGAFPTDVWTWDGAAWTPRRAEGPSGRGHHALAFDGENIMLFGGVTAAGKTGDSWTWNGSAWTRLDPDRAPGSHSVLVRDPATSAMLLVGGMPDHIVVERTAGGWRPLAAAGGPEPRWLPGAAFDEKRGVLVIYGGGRNRGGGLFDDTWELGPGGWTKR